MKKNITSGLLSIAMVLGSYLAVNAQSQVEISYQTALPMGELSDIPTNFSGRGFGLEYMYMVDDTYGFGLKLGWNVFQDVGPDNGFYETTTEGGIDLTIRGKRYSYVNAVPIMANIVYYIGTDDLDIRPVFGLGIGGMVIENRTDIGLFTASDRNFHFGLSPKIGVDIPAGSVSIVPSITYNFAPPANNSITYQYIGFNLGFKFL